MGKITAKTTVKELLEHCPSARTVLDAYGLHGCGGERGPAEAIEFFARVHQVNLEALLRDLNAQLEHPSENHSTFQETLPDYIYRRFFKAGIAIVLTIGGLWGAVNLLQIALGKSLLQLRLVPAIHAHAHAMIFGWVGLFVMGFAYQSFPRFKYTTLWRPELANASFYLMLLGIFSRIGAEMLVPSGVALALGAYAAAMEFAAIALFLLVLFQTARRSMEPRNPYEKFIVAALVWFVIQALFSDFFFFAKATAATNRELIRRIALLDGPLRDVQLLGFASLMIAGVSLRFVPAVYNLAKPERDRSRLIFLLMNAALILDVACFMLLVATRQVAYGVGLEISYLLTFLWAWLLARQLRVFTKPKESDRSWKFIRAAYLWLLVAFAMLPFAPLYGALTHQIFAHSYWGAYRHAFTVGFVSLMILGVSSRVVPILAGVDSKSVTALWGPFWLLNVGCAGRVVLQILTDFYSSWAYPLVGWTGFLEVAGLAWWGIGLWRLMNRAKTTRPALLRAPMPLPMR